MQETSPSTPLTAPVTPAFYKEEMEARGEDLTTISVSAAPVAAASSPARDSVISFLQVMSMHPLRLTHAVAVC